MTERLASRNDSIGFARRTRKNLDFIVAAHDDAHKGSPVHVVTQIVLSTLGLIVFPWERTFKEREETLGLVELSDLGWPEWEIMEGSADTFHELLRLLRNAIVDGNMHFTTESQNPEEVQIEFWNQPPGSEASNWRARILASELRSFCEYFTRLVVNTLD